LGASAGGLLNIEVRFFSMDKDSEPLCLYYIYSTFSMLIKDEKRSFLGLENGEGAIP
jgi:hypothetical protein